METVKVKLRPSSVAGRAGSIFYQARYGPHLGTDNTDLSNNVGKLSDRRDK